MQSILGAIPSGFTHYWIGKFPQLLSHSYHTLEMCSTENSFAPYYATNYKFAKPDYFYQPTEDFVPNYDSVKSKDSPKKYQKDARYNKNNDRRQAPQEADGNRNFSKQPPNENGFVKVTRKGAYNFHRNDNNLRKRGEGAAVTENARWTLPARDKEN